MARVSVINAVFSLGSQAQASINHDPRFSIQLPPLNGLLPPAGWTFGLAVKQDNTRLAQALSDAMQALEKNGELDRVFARHGVQRTKP